MVLRKSFYIRWSAGRSPRVHEVNPGRDPSGRKAISQGKAISQWLRVHSFHSAALFFWLGCSALQLDSSCIDLNPCP